MDNIILIEGGIIIAMGTVYAIQNKKPETPVLAGAIGLLLITSVMVSLGGNIAILGKALLSLATFSVVLAEGPVFLSGLNAAISHKGA